MIIVATIDKDNDFGRKTGIECPIFGEENVKNTIMEFGLVDPEDSDLNAAFMAFKLAKEKGGVPAIICGKGKFSEGNLEEVKRQLKKVISATGTNRVLLVTDGAEDDTVIPIVSTVAEVIDVYHVAVKQLPGMEKTWYIISGYLSEWFSNKNLKILVLMILSALFLTYGLVILASVWKPELAHYFASFLVSIIYLVLGLFFFRELVSEFELKVSFKRIMRYIEYFFAMTTVISGVLMILAFSEVFGRTYTSVFTHSFIINIVVLVSIAMIDKYVLGLNG